MSCRARAKTEIPARSHESKPIIKISIQKKEKERTIIKIYKTITRQAPAAKNPIAKSHDHSNSDAGVQLLFHITFIKETTIKP